MRCKHTEREREREREDGCAWRDNGMGKTIVRIAIVITSSKSKL